MNTSTPVQVSGFAMAVPPRCVTNDDLAQLMDTSDEWIVQRTGIKTRFWAEAPLTTSDIAVISARRTIELTGGESIDAIVAATLSPDYNFPGIGVSIQHKLGLPHIPAYDLRNQCAGFLYGLELAKALVSCGTYRRILLVGAEIHSTGLDISTRGRDLAVLFGDGAGSCIVAEGGTSATPRLEVLDTVLHSDGAHLKELWCEHPGSARFPTRLSPELVLEGKTFPTMNGRAVFEHAVLRMTEVSKEILARNQMTPQHVALFVPHQANARINSMVAQQLALRPEQVFNTIERYGNTTAATIPIGLTCAIEARAFRDGDIILSTAFGSGFVWGAALFRARVGN